MQFTTQLKTCIYVGLTMLLSLITDSLRHNAGSVTVENAGMSVLRGAFAPRHPLSMSVSCGRNIFTQTLTSTVYISKN